ncbi:MAG: hypothetical protein U0802_04035 [Candidatus Binatia bacterium]
MEGAQARSRGVAVVDVDGVEALNAFALHYGATLAVTFTPPAASSADAGAGGARHAGAPPRRAVGDPRFMDMLPDWMGGIDRARWASPAHRPRRLPQDRRDRLQGAPSGPLSSTPTARRTRRATSSGDDPRRRLGARQPLRDGLTKWAAYLACAGLAVVWIDYRLAPATHVSRLVKDCLGLP